MTETEFVCACGEIFSSKQRRAGHRGQTAKCRVTPEEIKASWRASANRYRQRHPERVKATWRVWYDTNREEIRAKHRSRRWVRHGLTQDEYEALVDRQQGRCAACGGSPGQRGLVLDHDHDCCPGQYSCGRCVRGLVCDQCNVALGMVRNDPARLGRLIEYLSARA